jgi:hypothetical protein
MSPLDTLWRFFRFRHEPAIESPAHGDRPEPVSVLDTYVRSAPSPQNALDLFRGEWSSLMPEPLAGLEAGPVNLFDDPRMHWFLDRIGGVAGKSVLELGPLEGGHACMLERHGAAAITSIEANSHAFLKCLVIKELLDLHRVRFLCGDFLEYLRRDGPAFAVCLASGVLYHMEHPVELLSLLARRCTEHLLLWSHYYDADVIASNPELAPRFTAARTAQHLGFRHMLYRQEYQHAVKWSGFCGAGAPVSHWMTRDEILDALRHVGFDVAHVGFEEPTHPNGPAFAVVARRRAPA